MIKRKEVRLWVIVLRKEVKNKKARRKDVFFKRKAEE